MTKDTLCIKEWAARTDKAHRETIDLYIKEGISPRQAVDMVMTGSTLGAGYRAQIVHDYIGMTFPADLIKKGF